VGRRLAPRLKALGIETVLQLQQADPEQLRQQFSVVMEKTISELNGESCLELEMEAPTKQQILCSRSFGEVVTDKHIMQKLVSGYIARAAEKLRYERQCCGHVQVFIRTSFFRQGAVQYSNAATTRFAVKTDDTRVLTRAALSLLDVIWKHGVRYAKAGVMLTELGDQGVVQQDLFNATNLESSKKLMALLDRINTSTYGKAWFASQGQQSPWTMKREHLSPAYTTQWMALPVVR
jgi:DNA polymerase V